MLKIFEGDPIMVQTISIFLDGNGVKNVVQGEELFQAAGEFPAPLPSVWIRNEDEARARSLLQARNESGTRWKCSKCGEEIEIQFDECWRCCENRPDTPLSDIRIGVGRCLKIIAVLCAVFAISLAVLTEWGEWLVIAGLWIVVPLAYYGGDVLIRRAAKPKPESQPAETKDSLSAPAKNKKFSDW
jgi:hypothetical protein